jgi:hypothetical protein
MTGLTAKPIVSHARQNLPSPAFAAPLAAMLAITHSARTVLAYQTGVVTVHEAAGRTNRRLAVSVAACVLLLAQFLLGMAVNVGVVLPAHHPGAAASNYFSGVASGVGWAISAGPAWVAAHVVLGLALVVAALAAIGLIWRTGSRTERAMSVLGLLFIIGAGFNGASFLNYGHAVSSFIMAALWALATTCYVTGAVLSARRT